MKTLANQLASAHRFGMTSRIYPKLHDTRVVLFIGMAYDVDNLQAFLDEHYETKIQ